MHKSNTKKLTLEDFIAKKINKDKKTNETKEIYVKSMDGYITIKRIMDNKLMEILDLINTENSYAENLEFNKQLIYHSTPFLQSQELHTTLEIKDPFDVVSSLFDIGEINQLVNAITKFLDIEETAEKIKN